jgi:hypothetical protein
MESDMNHRVTSGLVAVLAMGAASLALAQTQPNPNTTTPNTPPPSSYPQSSSPETSTSSSSTSSSSSMSGESHKQLLKDCMANEKAKNNGETRDQMKEICESQLKQSSSPR